MVKILIGHKGSGKTKRMIDLVNDQVQTAKGSIIFINKNSRLIYDLDYKIRVVCMEDFPHVTNEDEYIGFLFGIMSADNDIETIFLDGIMSHRDFALDILPRRRAGRDDWCRLRQHGSSQLITKQTPRAYARGYLIF